MYLEMYIMHVKYNIARLNTVDQQALSLRLICPTAQENKCAQHQLQQ